MIARAAFSAYSGTENWRVIVMAAFEPFPIIEVQPEWIFEQEALGSKRKFWYQYNGNGPSWLFKYPREGTGEHWAEKIAAELAGHLRIPHATVQLARFRGIYGSATSSFARGRRALIHGNQLIAGKVLGYDPEKRFHNADHTLDNVWRALEGVLQPASASNIAKRRFAQYLVVDALIGNTDRHHENWGVLQRSIGKTWKNYRPLSTTHHRSDASLPTVDREKLVSSCSPKIR